MASIAVGECTQNIFIKIVCGDEAVARHLEPWQRGEKRDPLPELEYAVHGRFKMDEAAYGCLTLGNTVRRRAGVGNISPADV